MTCCTGFVAKDRERLGVWPSGSMAVCSAGYIATNHLTLSKQASKIPALVDLSGGQIDNPYTRNEMLLPILKWTLINGSRGQDNSECTADSPRIRKMLARTLMAISAFRSAVAIRMLLSIPALHKLEAACTYLMVRG